MKTATTKHTPGPWETDGMYVQTVANRQDASLTIARASTANARLIAAAPDLLALARQYAETCCERIASLREELHDYGSPDTEEDIRDQIDHWHATLTGVLNVIKKAEGVNRD